MLATSISRRAKKPVTEENQMPLLGIMLELLIGFVVFLIALAFLYTINTALGGVLPPVLIIIPIVLGAAAGTWLHWWTEKNVPKW